jgi:hypothetical protein
VQQMKRAVRDHMESGYLSKVEYRAIKEPNQEIDYIIRYYPGPGASESNSRIQTYIREKKNRPRFRSATPTQQQVSPAATVPQALSLSVITANHHDLIKQLIVNFRINPLKACHLVLTRKEAVSVQLKAWPFRETKPRNLAGWMIQAIENDYELPASYLDFKNKASQHRALGRMRETIDGCALCDDKGFRHVFSDQYPNGAMRQCSHDPTIEAQFSTSPDALKQPPRDDFRVNENRPAEDSASL